jgi:hypothetical protein
MVEVRIGRPFNKQSYRDNDQRAKEAICKYLISKGVRAWIPEENYGADIHAYYPEEKIFARHEAEMKNQWDGDWVDCWGDVRVPARKLRLIEEGKKIIFWVVRTDCREAWRIRGSIMTPDMIKPVLIKKGTQWEKFFCIPVDMCEMVRLV